jgi:lysine-N-methylase
MSEAQTAAQPTQADLTLRYMHRFRCIGPECEDNCCHSWRVEVDKKSYEKLRLATRRVEKERTLFDGSLVQSKLNKRVFWAIKMKPSGLCPFLEESGMCHIQGTYGESYLSNVCASYPRRINKIGPRYELTGMASCPEVVRQLLLHEDAVDEVGWDHKALSRKMLSEATDPRDVRPYWRLQQQVRHFMLSLLNKTEYSLEKRFFFMTYFGSRTAEHFNAHAMKGNPAAVLKEMELLENPKVLGEMGRRLDAVETPSSLVLLLAREIVRGDSRSSFRALVQAIFESYENLMGIAPKDGPQDEEAESAASAGIWKDYRQRRGRVMALAEGRVSQYLHHFAYHYWVHRLHFESPDLLVHMLRLLCEMAVHKLLLFSHPWVGRAFDQLELKLGADPSADVPTGYAGALANRAVPPPTFDSVLQSVVTGAQPGAAAPDAAANGGSDAALEPGQFLERAEALGGAHEAYGEHAELGEGQGDSEEGGSPQARFLETLDRAAVDVFYKTARYMEHSTLLRNLETALAQRKLKSLAGAVYLIRF